MSDADEQWGARLKQARLAAGLSQKMLGIEAGIDAFVASTRINRYELGIHKPDLLTVRKLAGVLKVPVAFFTPTLTMKLLNCCSGTGRLVRKFA